MSTLSFDTLKFADTLKAAGVPDKQAEAEARVVAAAIGEVDVATKGDVRDVRPEVELLRREMQAMELRLTIKLGAFIAVAVGVIIAVLSVSH